MRILLIQDYLRSGGTERQCVLLANDFSAPVAAAAAPVDVADAPPADEKHSAALLTFRPGGALAGTVSPAVERFVLQPFDTGLDWFAPGLKAAVRRAAPDVILCMGRMANCHAFRLVDALPAVPVVATMRTGKPLPFLFRRSLHRAAHVVANSNQAASILTEKYGVPAAKVSVIYNAPVFQSEELRITNYELRIDEVPPAIAPVVLCCAMFRPEKGHVALLEAAAMLPRDAAHPWKLICVGDGVTLPACRVLAAKLGIAERVEFTGFVADPRPYYRRGTVAALASRSESLSNFLVEAHLHGVPSVAFAAGGVSECGGTVVPVGDTAALARKLAPLLFDPAARAAASAGVLAHARANFSRAAQLTAYLRLFRRLSTQLICAGS